MIIGSERAGAGAGAVVLIVVILGIAFYFLPSIIATSRKVPNAGSVFILNFFLGWTFVGWIVSLAMAFRDRPAPPVTVQMYPTHMIQGRAAAPPRWAPSGASPSVGTPTSPAAGVSPGWYADPLGNHQARYHDGNRWTDHVQ